MSAVIVGITCFIVGLLSGVVCMCLCIAAKDERGDFNSGEYEQSKKEQ